LLSKSTLRLLAVNYNLVVRNGPDTRFRWLRTWVPVAVVLAPVTLVSILVSRYYIPIPFHDEWALAPLISGDSLSVRALFAHHNEHLFVIPKLALVLIARATGWSLRIEPWLNIVVALSSVFALLILARTGRQDSPVPLLGAGFAVSAFLFSPAQYDVWLWPFMLTFTLTSCLLCLAAVALGTRMRHGFAAAVICCLLATLSSAQGLFTWVVLVPALVWSADSSRVRAQRILLWFAATILSCFAYFSGYRGGETTEVVIANLARPLALAEFAVTAIGAPWTGNAELALLAGAIQLVLLAWLCTLAARDGQTLRALCFAAIASWAVLFGVASGFGRLQYGVETALTSRYLASTAVFPAALFALAALLAQRRPRHALLIGLASVIPASLMLVASTRASLDDWRSVSLNRSRGATCLGMLDQTGGDANRCLELLYPSSDKMIERVEALEHTGIRTFRRADPLPVERSDQWNGRIFPRARLTGRDTFGVRGLMVDSRTSPGPGLVFLDAGDGRLWCCGFTDPEPVAAASPSNDPAFYWTADVPRALIEEGSDVVAYAFRRNPDRLVALAGILESATRGNPAAERGPPYSESRDQTPGHGANR
jgi:hypothetical protein